MSKPSKKSKSNRTPRLVFDKEGAFKKVAGLPQNPTQRAAALEQLLLELGGQHQMLVKNRAGYEADLQACSQKLDDTTRRNHALEDQAQELTSQNRRQTTELSGQKLLSDQLTKAKAAAEREAVRAANSLQLLLWVIKCFPDYRLVQSKDYGFETTLVLEFGGLHVEFEQHYQSRPMLTVQPADSTPIQIRTQTIMFEGKIDKTVFLQLRMLARAVTPEGKAELVNDPELSSLYLTDPIARDRGQRLRTRCEAMATRLGTASRETAKPQPGELYWTCLLGGGLEQLKADIMSEEREVGDASPEPSSTETHAQDDTSSGDKPKEEPEETLEALVTQGLTHVRNFFSSRIAPLIDTPSTPESASGPNTGGTDQSTTTK